MSRARNDAAREDPLLGADAIVRASKRVHPVRAMPNPARTAQKILQLSDPIPVSSSKQRKRRYFKQYKR